MPTVPQEMAGLERMLDYRSAGLQRFRCKFTNDAMQMTLLGDMCWTLGFTSYLYGML